jgi:hypothetical protein
MWAQIPSGSRKGGSQKLRGGQGSRSSGLFPLESYSRKAIELYSVGPSKAEGFSVLPSLRELFGL